MKLLIVGQVSQKTGLARVTRAIADHLAPLDEVHVLGIDCVDCGAESEWTLHRNPISHDPLAELQLAKLTDSLRPDAILLYNDFHVLERYTVRLQSVRHRCPIVGYCPVDGPIAPEHLGALSRLDELVVFTGFARGLVGRPAHVIPHGIDPGEFHPVDHARQLLFPDRPELWDGFIVLNANRNQPRKRLDLTMQGFARFAQNKPSNVRLYLHCGLNEFGIDVLGEARILGITDRLLFTADKDGHPDSPTSRLNLIYNACDVGVNTAYGEGWGLVTCEHAATRRAQIVPRHSACAELWDGAAELLDVVAVHRDPFYEGGIIDPNDLADALERLYREPQYREALAGAAHARITAPQYHWKRIAEQWHALFASITDTVNSSTRR